MKTSTRAALPLLLLLASPLVLADEVHFTDGSVQRECRVIEETCARVIYTVGAIRQSRPAREVLRVVHDTTPPALRAGLAHLEAGRVRDAIPDLVAAAEIGPAWARQQALRALGDAHLEAGDAPASLRAFDALLERHPTTRLLGEALVGRVRALRVAGDFEGTHAALCRARLEVSKDDLGDRWVLRLDLEEARLGDTRPDRRAALARYTRLVSAAAADPEVLAEALVGRARALLDTGDVAEATSALRDLLSTADLPDPLAAQATALLADCLARTARPRDAFLAYLEAALVHGDPRAYREAARLVRAHPDLGGEPRARALEAELAQHGAGRSR